MSFKISEVCDINSFNLSKNDNLNAINYLDTANLNVGTVDELQYMEVGKDKIPSRAKRIVRKNDILISTVRPNQKHYGIIKNVAKNMVASTGFAVLTPKEDKVDPGYIYNYLIQDHITTYLHSIAESSTSTYPSIKPSVIGDLEVDLPPLEEQKAIAHILSTLDDRIEVNNQINKTLENMAQTIFKQWFVDYEYPNENSEPYKSNGGEMVESELGLIPKGWGVEEIGNISDIQNGFAFKAPEYVDEGVKVLRTLNIGNDGYFNNTDIVFLPQSYKSEKYEKYYFEEFDVALVMVGASIGKIGMILKNTAGGLQNQNMWRFRRKEKRVSQIFIYYTVKQAQNISKNWSTGSARDFYRKDSFRKIKVILPEKRIMDLFEKITKPIFQNISNHVCENDELISMRDGLLPKLMSGEIRVPLYEEGDAS